MRIIGHCRKRSFFFLLTYDKAEPGKDSGELFGVQPMKILSVSKDTFPFCSKQSLLILASLAGYDRWNNGY
jgi:hypothetical protein